MFNKRRNLLAVPLQQLAAIIEEASKAVKAALDLLNDTWQKINESLKKLIPKLKESWEKILAQVIDVSEDVMKFVLRAFEDVLDKVKEHEEEIKELITTVTDFVHGKFVKPLVCNKFDQHCLT